MTLDEESGRGDLAYAEDDDPFVAHFRMRILMHTACQLNLSPESLDTRVSVSLHKAKRAVARKVVNQSLPHSLGRERTGQSRVS